MNEIKQTFFQMKPRWEWEEGITGEREWPSYKTRVMFMQDMFDLDHIFYISTINSRGPQLYDFTVTLCDSGRYSKEVTFEFTQKSVALKALRELGRAYTRTEEFSEDEFRRREERADDEHPRSDEGLRRPTDRT